LKPRGRVGRLPQAALLRTFDRAHHYSQHAFIGNDKSAKNLFNIADQDQPFPNFSGDSAVLPGIANLFQRGELFAG
jgi:hypothetical protein